MISQETGNVCQNGTVEEIIQMILEAVGFIHDRADAMQIVTSIETECELVFNKEADGQTPKICRKRPN